MRSPFLDRGFQRLTLDHRGVIVLRLYLGLPIEETASTLGIPVGTAKSRLHYATEAMRLAGRLASSPEEASLVAALGWIDRSGFDLDRVHDRLELGATR
jgi:hypothetical protein